MTEPTFCLCEICCKRRARGELPFEGVSVSTTQHVLASELPASSSPWKQRGAPAVPPPPPRELRVITADKARALIRAEVRRHADAVLCEAVGVVIGEVRVECEKRIENLEAQLMQMKELGFKGVWEQDKSYRRNNIVSCGGSAFVCVADTTTAKPGTDPAAWSLLSARGRDGRDAAQPEASTTRSHR